MTSKIYRCTRLLPAASLALFGLFLAASASALTLSITGPSTANVGDTGLSFDIVADEELTLGSTDIEFNWDVIGLTATNAGSSVLSSFTSFIDNPARQVRTASASATSDVVPAGTALMTFTMTADSLGTYNLFITDGDGNFDLAGPVPPIPPDSIPFVAVGHAFAVVPEPGTGLLAIPGLIGLAITGRRRRG